MSDTPLNMQEFTQRSEAYFSEIKSELEEKYKGQFAALDYESKQYWIGSSASEALIAAKKDYPNKLFYLVRVGSSSAFSIQAVFRGDDFGGSYDYQ